MAVAADARMLVADPAKLHDILRNLIENAVNYTPEDGAIELATRLIGDRFELTVSDTGPGLPEQDLLARVRALLPRGQVAGAARRHRARPGDRQAPRAGDGRNGGGRQPPKGGAVFTVRLPLREVKE